MVPTRPSSGRDADDDFQHHQAAFQAHDFAARGGFQRADIFRLGPVQMVGGEEQQAAERRGILLAQRAQVVHVVGRVTFRERGGDGRRRDHAPAQHPRAPQNDPQPDHRSQSQHEINGSFHKMWFNNNRR